MAEAGTRSSLRKQCICLVIVCRVHCTCVTTALLYMLGGHLGYQYGTTHPACGMMTCCEDQNQFTLFVGREREWSS